MTAYTIPPKQTKIPLILDSGDTLTVNHEGKSIDVTVNDGATETVTAGGSSFRTTINDGGTEFVNGGTLGVTKTVVDFTTINGGGVILTHATADHTRINFLLSSPLSQMDLHDHSVAKDTIIEGGGILAARADPLSMRPASPITSRFIKTGRQRCRIGVRKPFECCGIYQGSCSQ